MSRKGMAPMGKPKRGKKADRNDTGTLIPLKDELKREKPMDAEPAKAPIGKPGFD